MYCWLVKSFHINYRTNVIPQVEKKKKTPKITLNLVMFTRSFMVNQ